MTTLFKKLNYKDQSAILILNSPASFKDELTLMKDFTTIKKFTKGLKEITFVLAFVKSEIEIEKSINQILPLLINDGVFWFAYPKGTSKKYKVNISRDNGWETLGNNGFETVRAVSIDEDWSALRFRKVENIKSITRNKKIAISKVGKERAV